MNNMLQSNNKEHQILIRQILKTAEEIFQEVKPIIPSEWLTSDVTVAQLRVLLVLYAQGSSRMSSIASYIGIAISTATSIVENLVKKGLVVRSDVPEDRRLVICTLSPKGQKLINRLWMLGRVQIEKLLQGLTLDQLKKAAEVAGFILSSAQSNSKNTQRLIRESKG
jgi:DNA-binding MarR family transcriptional regulator